MEVERPCFSLLGYLQEDGDFQASGLALRCQLQGEDIDDLRAKIAVLQNEVRLLARVLLQMKK